MQGKIYLILPGVYYLHRSPAQLSNMDEPMRITNCENNAQNNDTLARVGTITTIRRKERNTSDAFTFDRVCLAFLWKIFSKPEPKDDRQQIERRRAKAKLSAANAH